MAATPTPRSPEPPKGEERLLVHDVSWATYVVLRDSLDDQRSKLHLTYHEGTLELMSPSHAHEETKKLIARLIEAYADAMDLDFTGRGSETFREEAKRGGLEADECYSLGPKGAVPDLAIEVVYSRPKIDKLTIYRALGVPEVWVWQEGLLRAFVLDGTTYRESTTSRLLASLDRRLLASFVRDDESQATLVKTFRAAIVGGQAPRP